MKLDKQYSKIEAQSIFRAELGHLTQDERALIEKVLERVSHTRDANEEIRDRRTFGERTADIIAAFGGSWTFIIMFFSFLVTWAFLNTEILGPKAEAFDPYPYVFLNLILSMLAAIQAPIIMMSQNRQSARDRIDAEVDHEVNVRAELAIQSLESQLKTIELQLAKLLEETEPLKEKLGLLKS